MALSTYALASLAELNSAVQEATDSPTPGTQDGRKEDILNQVSIEIENHLDRQVVTRGALTEYHSPRDYRRVLYLSQYPLVGATSTISVREDPNWEAAPASAYGASTLLVENVDYYVIKLTEEPAPFVKLYRLGKYWAVGYRRIKVDVSSSGCGYANTAGVPTGIKGVCLEVAARVWRDRKNAEIGVVSRQDSTGTITRQLPALLLEEDKRKLAPYRRLDFAPTWERAA